MIKTLIIICSLNKQAKNEELLKAIKKFSECFTVHFQEINDDYEVDENIDAVVISGSAARIVNSSHRKLFKGTVDLISRLNLPVFSICYGHQLLCWSLGAKVASLSEGVMHLFEKVRVVEVDEIFSGFEKGQKIPVAQSHYDYVLRESLDKAGLILLADSHSCEVEAIKHKNKPFYGVQFHPERINIKNKTHPEGYKVIENFYKNVVKR
jgi:GMP synthase-like glutamine amidotransferase